ncbi:uncharacterized protein LDX57_005187 [Aspergillus melleus]|uniref:uncharacterized protein n=1 Tax=Aspergillus melleus TaxID=138277 RepID=UPI001E8E9327|nr:uncharacterized protein LDX57_005187 [Aspergillus melleus]KAH8427474.1 hypothetical protein LDX57_005187 [Aspergillus melleus]
MGTGVAVQRLVEAGAELWRKKPLGYSPFMMAKMYNHDEIADLILKLGQPSDFTTATGLPTTVDKRNERNNSTRGRLLVPEDGSNISQSRHSRLNQTVRQEFEGFDMGQKKPFEPESMKTSKEIKIADNTWRKNQHWIHLLWEQTPWVILTTLFFLIAATAVIRPNFRKIESMDTFLFCLEIFWDIRA